jgi:allene oxide cyclase
MKRLLSILVPLAGIVALVAAVGASSQASSTDPAGKGDDDAVTVTVIEHAENDTTTDTGAQGDSTGDIFTFANKVYDAADRTEVGTDQGFCIRITPGTSYECTWTTLLEDGHISVTGPFYDARESTLAITGGTGRYKDASGSMLLEALANGTKFRFTFQIED